MTKSRAMLAGVLVLFFSSGAAAMQVQRPVVGRRPIAITHVTVIDVAAGREIADQTVHVDSGRIVAVGPSVAARIRAGAKQVDGRGKFLIPGLWDMHVHVFGNVTRPGTDTHELSFPLFIANGVTGVRDMWTDLEDLRVLEGWRREAAAGRLLMPRVVPTSTVIDGPDPSWPTSPVFTSPDVARHFVDSLYAGGARTIKVLGPPRDVYYAVIDEAKKLGIPVVGHVPLQLSAIEASNAGQRSIEHTQAIPEGCAKGAWSPDSLKVNRRATRNARQRYLIEAYDDSTCDAMIRVLAKNETWQVPTQMIVVGRLLEFEDRWMADPRLRYAAAVDTAEWRAGHDRSVPETDSATRELRRRMAAHRSKLIGRLYHGGVPFMVGTDLGNPFIIAGFSLHDELTSLVQAGFTPAEALRAATSEPARFLGATDSLGTVTTGKRADLVLLDANPLLDIGNTTRIRAVVLDGRYLDRTALDTLLATAARLAPDIGTARGGASAPRLH